MKRLKNLCILVVSPGGGTTLNPKWFPSFLQDPKLWKLDPGFHVRPHQEVLSFLFFNSGSPVFSQNKNSWFSMWEPVGEPSPPVRTAKV
jgi:hypothetical protein